MTHKTLTVQLLTGTIETVTVKALPITMMEKFLAAQGDPAAVIQLCSDANPEAITAASALDIIEAADELNDPLAQRLLARQEAIIARYEQPKKSTRFPTSSPTSSPTALPPVGATLASSHGPRSEPCSKPCAAATP